MAAAPRPRRVRPGLLVLLLVALAALGWAAWDLHHIRRDLAAGQRTLAELSLDDADDLGAVTARAAEHLDDAAERATGSAVLSLLGHVPLVDDQVAGLRSLTGDAASIGRLARDGGGRLQLALDDARSPAGRVALLDAVERELEVLDGALRALADVPLPTRRGPVAGAQRRFLEEVDATRDRLDDAAAVVEPLRDLLQGPSTHLLLAANNAEMAGGAGLTLSAGRVRFDGGQVTLDEMVPAGDLRHAVGVDAPEALRRLYETTGIGLDLRSTTRSPDLGAMGPVAAALVEAQGWGPVDGVIVVDAVALAELLEVTGPVQASGVEVDAGNVLAEILHEGYRRADRAGDVQGRFDHQSRVAGAVVDAVTSRQVAPAEFAGALVDAAAGRHLLAWAEDPRLQSAWQQLGVSGALPEDGLLVSFQNHGADKMDWYLRPEAALDVRRQPDGDFRAQLTLTLEVPARAEVLEATPYILGPTPDDHEVLLSLHLPAAARDITTTHPGGFHRRGVDAGLPVRTFLEEVPAGGRFERVVHFTLPATTTSLTLVPSARVEPLPLTIDGVVTVDDATARSITWLAAWGATDGGGAPTWARVAVALGAVGTGSGATLLAAWWWGRRRRLRLRPR